MTVLLVSAAALFAMEKHGKSVKKQTETSARKEDNAAAPVYDSLLLKRFTSAIRSLDFNRPICTYAGVINLDDPNDTSNSVHNLKFLFCRTGGGYYYRLGTTEIIHQGKLNIYVQHDQHKVVISGQQIVVQPPVKDLAGMMKYLQSENYELRNSSKGNKQTLALVNEQHLSCKELSVTLDINTGKLERIYSRLNDFGSPKDKGKDRVIDVRILQLSDRGDRSLYTSVDAVVRKENSRWALKGKYATYELIML